MRIARLRQAAGDRPREGDAPDRRFISSMESEDPDWPNRLKTGFVIEYLRLRKEGHRGDDLFERMCAYATRGFPEQTTRCAAISVLVYLFEACEVFER